MSVSMMIFAEVEFPPGCVERWRALAVEGPFDWGECTLMEDPHAPTSVSAILASVRDYEQRKPVRGDHMRLTVGATQVSLRAYINESDYIYWGPLLSSMVRVASDVGAKGEYGVMTVEGDGERLVVDGSNVRAETFFAGDMEELDTLLDYERLFDEAMKESEPSSGRGRGRRR